MNAGNLRDNNRELGKVPARAATLPSRPVAASRPEGWQPPRWRPAPLETLLRVHAALEQMRGE
jgi:hypothetical protein